MLPLLLALNASAVAPTGQATALELSGAGPVVNGTVSDDGETVSFVAEGAVHVIHVPTWTVATAQQCNVSGATVITVDTGTEVWVGCDSGAVQLWQLVGDSLSRVVDTEGEAIVFAPTAGAVGAMYASEQFGQVYAVVESGDGSQQQIQVYDAVELETGLLVSLGRTENRAAAIGPQYMYVAHENSLVSAFVLASNAVSPTLTGTAISVEDLAATRRPSAWAVDRDNSVWDYLPSSSSYFTLLPSAPDIQAVGVSTATDDEFGLLAYPDEVRVHAMAGGAIGAEVGSFAIDGTVRDVITSSAGYSFAGTTDGRILVWTHRPWVSDVQASPEDVALGDTVTVRFTTDRAGDWEIALGGTWESSDSVVGTGVADAAGAVEAELTVGADWAEGDNDVFVRLTDDDGYTGHGRARLVVDTPPGAVVLGEGALGFDDQVISLSFTALDAPDIATYTVYVTVTEFTAADHPTGGPAFDGTDEIVAPVQVADFIPGENVRVTLSPLTNDQTYYLAVRATDEGGLEGPMSDVVSGTPRPTYTASELAGEEGGPDCNSVGGRGLPGLGLLGLAALGVALRRRRTGLAGLAALGLVGLAVPTSAEAQDEAPAADEDDEEDGKRRPFERGDDRGDLTQAWGSVELRYGIIQLDDENLNLVYGKGGNNLLLIDFGPQLFRFAELDLGVGFFQELGNRVDENGDKGSAVTMITAIPLSAAITGRLHVFDEQLVVPYASFGLDAWTWEERDDDGSGGKDKLTGTKFGSHWAVGGSLMLDPFSRRRASLLEAQTGINDSYLTFDYRQQTIRGDAGLDFSGWAFTAGLKFDF